jgi:hypothetical protein
MMDKLFSDIVVTRHHEKLFTKPSALKISILRCIKINVWRFSGVMKYWRNTLDDIGL